MGVAVFGVLVIPWLHHVVFDNVIPLLRENRRWEQAREHMRQRCLTAGQFISRTVPDVEEIQLLNVREERQRSDAQFALWDPYGSEPAGEAYIGSFLDDEHGPRAAPDSRGIKPPRRYRAVFAKLPGEGLKRYRFAPREVALQESPEYQDPSYREAVERRAQLFSGQPVIASTARYGVRFKDISTREDRNDWIAGSSLQVVDLQTGEVIAERVGYLWDAGLGQSASGRSPWGMAAHWACPSFHPLPGMSGFTPPSMVQDGQAFRFVSQVLIPKQ